LAQIQPGPDAVDALHHRRVHRDDAPPFSRGLGSDLGGRVDTELILVDNAQATSGHCRTSMSASTTMMSFV
jgi:hypothetical protein